MASTLGITGISAHTDMNYVNSLAQAINQTITLGTAEVAPATFYSKQLLDTIRYDESQYVYYRLADPMPIMEKADKLVIRRWAPLYAHTEELLEGIPPVSDKGSVEAYELQARSYGRFMEFSDKVSWKFVDPIITHYSKQYSIVAIETLDLLARNTLLTNSQKRYAYKIVVTVPTVCATAADVDVTSIPRIDELRQIILAMKKALVHPRSNGKYHVIGSPEFYFDLIDDPRVEKYMQYNMTTKPMYEGGQAALPPMFDMEFYETMLVPTSGEYIDGTGTKRLRLMKVADGSLTPETHATAQVNLSEDNPGEYSLVSGYVNDIRTGAPGSYIPNKPTWVIPAGYVEFKMQHIMVLGADALTRTGLSGEDAAKMYVKPLGSAGVLDPIDQRQSIGFKINSVGFGSTRLEAIEDYVCVPTQVNI